MKLMMDENVIEYTDEETNKKYLVNPQYNEILEMNETAEIVLGYVKKQYDIEKIISEMMEKFEDVSQKELEEDIDIFLRFAVEHHICVNYVQTAG